MTNRKANIIPIEALEEFEAINQDTKSLIGNIEKEEAGERIETLDSIQNDIKAVKANVDMKKSNYIIELQAGLGEKVRSNPTSIKKLNNKWYQRLGASIKRIFTKF